MPQEVLAAGLTMDQLNQLVINAIRAAKEPSPEEAAKLAAEAERKMLLQKQSAAEQVAEQEGIKKRQDACVHIQNSGFGATARSTIRGQVHSDGLFHGLCLVCQKEFPPRKMSSDERPEYIGGAL